MEALGALRTITIYPAVSEDFLNYSKLFDFFYKVLTGHSKKNHIFSLFYGSEMVLRESVLPQDFIYPIMKKDPNVRGAKSRDVSEGHGQKGG